MGTGSASVVVVIVNAARTRSSTSGMANGDRSSNTTLHDMYVKNMKDTKEEEKKGEAGEMHRWKG
jgi:hypothetical protein